MTATPAEPTPAPTPAAPAAPAAPVAAPPADPAPAAAAPPVGEPAKKSLEDNLAGLDDDARAFVLDQVTKARNEAKNLRTRLQEAEPKLTEYDRLVQASQTELERAQQAAQAAEGTISAMRERVASADIRAALTGIVPDPESVIEDLNISRFIGDDGEVNAEAITALRAKYAALAPEGKRLPAPNPAQGSSAAGAPDASALIAEAKKNGDWQTVIALENQKLATPQRG